MNNSDILGEEAAARQIVENDFSATDGHFEDDSVTVLRYRAFQSKTSLKSITFPNVVDVTAGENHFGGCTNLETVSMPNLTRIAASMFNGCSKLETIEIPKVTGSAYMSINFCFRSCPKLKSVHIPLYQGSIGSNVFSGDSSLTIVDLGSCNSLGASTFSDCVLLTAIVLRNTAVVGLSNINTFNNTKYAVSGAGGAYVYVPRNLISSYQAATNWSTLYAAHSDMFRALEDYTVDGTTTGEFDEASVVTPTNPMYAVTNLDVSVDENHQRYITTTAEGHITYSSGAFTSENWSSVCIQSDEVGKSVSGNYFSIPAGSTVTMVIKNMTATQWDSVGGMRNQVSVRMRRSGADLYDISWFEMKQAFYTDGLHRYEESYTNTGNSAITISCIDLYGSLTPNNTLDFTLMVLLDGVRII